MVHRLGMRIYRFQVTRFSVWGAYQTLSLALELQKSALSSTGLRVWVGDTGLCISFLCFWKGTPEISLGRDVICNHSDLFVLHTAKRGRLIHQDHTASAVNRKGAKPHSNVYKIEARPHSKRCT